MTKYILPLLLMLLLSAVSYAGESDVLKDYKEFTKTENATWVVIIGEDW